MNSNDKNLLKNSGLVLVDNAVASVDIYWQQKTGLPLQPFGTCWGLLKGLYGSVIARRSERALEVVSMVEKEKETFPPEVLTDEDFQDGFAYVVERYLVERNEEKRRIARNIIMGFAKVTDKNNFPLERMSHTLSQLSETDIETLKDVKADEQGQNYQIYGENANRIENIYNLISQGILLNTTGSRIGYNPSNSPFVKPSIFGKEFIKYITK